MNIRQLEQLSPGQWFYDVRDQLKWHVYRRSEHAFAAGDAARDAITTPEALEARRQEIRKFFIERSLGGLPPMDTPLNAQTVGTVEGYGFHIEKVIFQSRPRNYVTANLYLPDGLDGPRGAVLFVCGHANTAKGYSEYQAVCQYLAQAGLIVLAQDPIGQGERYSYYEPALKGVTVGECCPDHDYAGAQCQPLGDNLARYFVHDSMRAVDYLCSRPEVDPDRIGITGNSGGGTQTCLMLLADPRLAAAAPGTFIMNRETYMFSGGAQDAEQIWPGFTAAGYDHEDVLLMLAPKPMRVLAVTEDFFPIEGTRRTVARCKRLWGLYGQEANIDLVEDVASHAYTRPLARAAAEFFSRHLLGREATPDPSRIAPFSAEKLWCTQSGQVRGEMEGTVSVHEANVERLQQREKQRAAIPEAERHERAITWLRNEVMRDRKPCDLNPRFYTRNRMDDLAVSMCLWWTQEGLHNHGCGFRDIALEGQKLPVTLALWDGGTNCLQSHSAWIRQTCKAGRMVLVQDVVGSGVLLPHSLNEGHAPEEFYGVIHKLSDDLAWLDDSLAAMRVYDVLRALDMIALWPGADASDIRIYAHGRQGVYGRLAAPLDSRIRSVEAADGMKSYAEWVGARHYDAHNIKSLLLRGMLQYFDLPEIEAI
ncbi:MAG TPA: prolyl oligopeptidase family serine peptidase [Chthonomonadaceae bacterium]|nr:prolyl oligopeptidase family serine peptidase [Chthonomonadaceae bacterium]